MPGHYDTPRVKVKASVALVFKGIPEKNTANRTGGEFMRTGSICVGETQAPKHPKMLVVGMMS